MSRQDALLDACHKRVRPIVMTTIAMGAGMMPIAMSWGAADGSFRSPMGVAVIGGLITSTLLSLLVIPAVYTFVDDFESLCAKGWKKLTGTSETQLDQEKGQGLFAKLRRKIKRA
jgi:Cu/Ag efflux pump CusA